MISTRRGIIIGLVVGSLIGGTAGATILEASGHGQTTAQLSTPAAPMHASTGQIHATAGQMPATADYESSSTT